MTPTSISVEAPGMPASDKAGRPLGLKGILLWVTVAALAFHAAYAAAGASWLIVVYLFALVQLARADTWRKRCYAGLAVGFLIAVGQLDFFWRIFSGGAVALWYVIAFWIGLFVGLAGACLRRWTGWTGWVLVPFIWAGLEYFRSELYYLRFSWVSPGYALAGAPWQGLAGGVGVYGAGFLMAGIACLAVHLWPRWKIRAVGVLALGMGGLCLLGLAAPREPAAPAKRVQVAGIQMEFPAEPEVLYRLNDLVRKHPETELIVLSEYTFNDTLPEKVRAWCRANRRYLVIGAKDPAPGSDFYNTAFVIGPDGEIVFRQVKCVPIQFFKDGRPAPEQKLWNSPWGKIGFCICYDLSYSRVTDRLVRSGAQALIVPTMDVEDWGKRQHELHARVTPVRAAEYGLPILRIASSGISQWVGASGRVLAAAPCPGPGAVICGALEVRGAGRLPPDRWLAPVAVGMTATVICWLAVSAVVERCWRRGRVAAKIGT